MKSDLLSVAVRTSVLYAVAAALWILLSDRILVALVSDIQLIGTIAMLKGWAFVAVTALLLYGTLRSQLGRWAREVKAREEAELAQRQAEHKYRTIFANASEGIFQTSPEGRFLEANAAMARILGYASAAELMTCRTDLRHQGYVRPEDRDAFRRRIEVEGKVEGFEYEAWRKDGGTVWVSETARVVRDAAGRVQYYEGFMEDISARKRAEAERAQLQAQLLQAQKMESIGRLAGGVAHDFNNMLTAIQGNLSLALTQLPPDSPVREHLLESQACARRSGDLTRQLLAFARRQMVQPQVLDLNATVEGMLKMLRRLIGEDIDLVWNPGPALWSVEIDPSQVDQLLANLCVNARDAIAGNGQVTIATSNASFTAADCADRAGCLPGDYVRLVVRDSGCGMTPEVQQHLFEPFFTTKGLGQGTGLGLATVYGIVRQNQGFITVHSAPGQGTAFELYLPRCDPARRVAPAASPAPAADAAATSSPAPARPVAPANHRAAGTVLLVEDEPTILRIGQRTLAGLGYHVLTAASPAEALALAEQHAGAIDLLITDVILPEMDGCELARRLQAGQSGLRCLFMSGYTDNVLTPHGVLDGSVHFLAKPFTVQELGDKVQEVLTAAGPRTDATP